MRRAWLLFAVAALASPAAAEAPAGWPPFSILGQEVAAGHKQQIALASSESFVGISIPTPVLVARGAKSGPTLCLTAGIHGDELNGVEVVRRVFQLIETRQLNGTLLAVPIANMHGFRRSDRYLPDRRDLNRFFPGNPDGSSASRIAHVLFEKIVRRCDALVDLHTGSFHRTNLPQLRADVRHPPVVDLARGFGAGTVVHSEGAPGTLRRAAVEAGIPAITYEAGEPMRFQDEVVNSGVEGVLHLMRWIGLTGRKGSFRTGQVVYPRSHWVRVDDGGILFSHIGLGDEVRPGDLLGTVTDPITNDRSMVRSPITGRVIGMALNQVVIPGFAAYHVGTVEMEGLEPGEAVDVSSGAESDSVDDDEERPE